MLSKLAYKRLLNRSLVNYLKRLANVCLYVGLFWLSAINFIFSQSLNISENAFKIIGDESQTNFRTDEYKFMIDRTVDELINLRTTSQYNYTESSIEYILNRTKELNLETHIQEFSVNTGSKYSVKGRNIYTYLRSQRSSQKDCLLIAYRHNFDQFNMAYHLALNNANAKRVTRYGEIATTLTLMKHLVNQNWLSRDIIFLGYDGDFQYGTGVRNFLKEYYCGEDENFVRGGIIRQGIALEFNTDTFNTYGVQLRNFKFY